MEVTPRILAEALRDVPATHLRLLDLARELALPDGSIDLSRAKALDTEIQQASLQARAYSNAVRDMARGIARLPAVPL